MQQKNDKTKLLAKIIGVTIKELRTKNKNCSINQFAHEYDLDVGNTSRIENGYIDVKVVTLWKLSEALGLKPSEFFQIIESKLDKNFQFFEN